MGMVGAIRMMNAINNGTTSGSALQTLLGAAENYGEFCQMLSMPGQCQVFAVSPTAMTAIAASALAMAAITANPTPMTAVTSSHTAMTAIATSSTADNLFMGSSYAVGAGLNMLNVNGGGTTNATLAGLATMTAVAASSTAMTAVAASSTAMTAVAASSTAMTAVAASSTAMTAVAASNAASDAVFTSSTARLAIYNSDTALSAFQANTSSPTQVSRQIGIGGRTSTGSTSGASYTYVANGTKVILLRAWTTGGAEDLSLNWGRGLTASGSSGGVELPNGAGNLGVSSPAIGRTATYANSGTYPDTNNDNANVVSAANGLSRQTWSQVGGTTQNVIYITV